MWDAVGPDMTLKTETKVISGRINDLAWDGESQRIIAVGDGKERYGHAFTYDSGNTVGEVLSPLSGLTYRSVDIPPSSMQWLFHRIGLSVRRR